MGIAETVVARLAQWPMLQFLLFATLVITQMIQAMYFADGAPTGEEQAWRRPLAYTFNIALGVAALLALPVMLMAAQLQRVRIVAAAACVLVLIHVIVTHVALTEKFALDDWRRIVPRCSAPWSLSWRCT